MRSQRQLDAILNKMQERISAQIEQNLKETEQARKIILNLEDLYSHFLSLRPLIKKNFKKQIDSTFSVGKIKDEIKQPGITPERKKELWNSLKLEVFTHAVYTLSVVPLVNLITYLRDCAVQKYEKEFLGDEQAIEILNDFMNDLSEFIVTNGCSQMYSYLKSEVAGAVGPLTLTEMFDIEKIDGKIGELLDIATKKSAIERINKDSKEALPNGNETGFSNVLADKIKPSKKRGPSMFSKDFYQLTVPEVRMTVVTQFLKHIWDRTPKIDEHFLLPYINNTALQSNGSPSEELSKSQGDDTKVDLMKTEASVSESVVEESKGNEKQSMDQATRAKLVLDMANKVTNEFLDLLESKSFDIVASFSIRYEFLKLKNRLLLFFEKTKTADKMSLANYLTKINQIVNDEFLDENSDQNNEDFYTRRLKLALMLSSEKHANQVNQSGQELLLTYNVLREYEAANLLSDSIKEFGKRVCLEEYYGKYFETGDQNKEGESGEMEEFLKSISHFTGKEEGVFG